MKHIHKLFLFAVLVAAISSCTVITSTNVPGTKTMEFTKQMCGTYELEYPGDLAALMEGQEPTIVTIQKDRMLIKNSDGVTETILGDSMYLSKVGANYYLSLGEAPSINVFKMVVAKKEISLYTLAASEYTDQEALAKYFAKVEAISEMSEPEEGEEATETISYSVTIDDAKLEDYFKSGIPMKDPFKLKKTKKK